MAILSKKEKITVENHIQQYGVFGLIKEYNRCILELSIDGNANESVNQILFYCLGIIYLKSKN